MKVIAYIPLHYSGSYLSESIKSIHNHVDRILIFYSPKPSFGHGTNILHPENMEDIKQMALNTSNKVEWIERQAGTEGEQTNYIYEYSSGYDLILRADSDEVWEEEDLKRCLIQAHTSNERNYGIAGFVNFFRSFNTACFDHFTPIRIIKPSGIARTEKVLNGTIYHFSTAQTETLTEYKISIHGHKNEIRPEWFEHVFLKFEAGITKDLHLTSHNLWEGIPFDKKSMPDILKSHPFYLLDKIV